MNAHYRYALACAANALIIAAAGCASLPELTFRKPASAQQPVALNSAQVDALGRAQPGSSPVNSPLPEAKTEMTAQTRSHVALAMGELLESNNNLSGAQTHFEQALKLEPDSLKAALALARVYARLGRPDAALKVYEETEKRHRRSPAVHNDKGLLLAEQRDWPNAIAALRSAVKLEPKESKYHNNLGMVLASSGDYDEALKEFREAVGPGPAHYNVAVMLLRAGRTAEARGHLEQAITAFPNLKEAQTLLAELNSPPPQPSTPVELQEVPVDLQVPEPLQVGSHPAPPATQATPDVLPADVSQPAESPDDSTDPAADSNESIMQTKAEFHSDPWSKPWAPPKWLR